MDEGDYGCEVTDLGLSPSKQGKAQVTITVRFTGNGNSQLKSGYFSLEGGAKQYTVDLLKGLGLKGKPDTWAQQARGLKCVASLKWDDWNGKRTLKLKSLRLDAVETPKAVLDALASDASLDLGGNAPKAHNSTDDDIPF